MRPPPPPRMRRVRATRFPEERRVRPPPWRRTASVAPWASSSPVAPEPAWCSGGPFSVGEGPRRRYARARMESTIDGIGETHRPSSSSVTTPACSRVSKRTMPGGQRSSASRRAEGASRATPSSASVTAPRPVQAHPSPRTLRRAGAAPPRAVRSPGCGPRSTAPAGRRPRGVPRRSPPRRGSAPPERTAPPTAPATRSARAAASRRRPPPPHPPRRRARRGRHGA